MNDSRRPLRTQPAAPLGAGLAVAPLRGCVSTFDDSVSWAAEPALVMAFGTACGLVLLGPRKRLATRRD